MTDRTIPFYNTILRCDNYIVNETVLPAGFSVVTYQKGYEKAWAAMECDEGDFSSAEEAEKYFTAAYLQDEEQLGNILFAVNSQNEVVGSCIAWRDKREASEISSLHWLIVDERYRGMGLGKALCGSVMNIFEKQRALPIYIHTQPWSVKAIFLYLSMGFKIQKTDTFSHYINEYDKAMDTLKKIVSKKQYELLCELSEQ